MAARWLSGQLSRIKTRQKFYRLVDHVNADGTTSIFNPDGGFDTVKMYHWAPCRLSTKLLVWGMHHDSEHHDHWGLVHRSTEKFLYACPVCGGGVQIFPRGPGLRDEDDD